MLQLTSEDTLLALRNVAFQFTRDWLYVENSSIFLPMQYEVLCLPASQMGYSMHQLMHSKVNNTCHVMLQ